ncbi:MAG: dihydroorotate dehydrogenase [Pseudomonadota bacterium]
MAEHEKNQPVSDEAGLDAFFAAARDRSPRPSEDLMARVLADASDAQPEPQPVAAARPSKTSWHPRWITGIGGWPGVAGLATVTMAGLWIGVALPETVGDLAFGLTGDGYDFSGLSAGFETEATDG